MVQVTRETAVSRPSWRRLTYGFFWLLRVLVIGISVTASAMLALVATEHLPAERMQANLQASFAEGSLQEKDWLHGNRTIGFNQYNDCLLVMMASFRTDPWSSAIAPTVIFNDYPTPMTDAAGDRLPECTIARRAVFSDRPLEIFEAERYYSYGRYVHSYRIPFNLAVALGPLSNLRMIYRVAGVAILLCLLVIHGARALSALRASGVRAAAVPFSFCAIAGAFLFLFGLDLFGPSFTHGPADILLFIAFGWLSLRPSLPGAGGWDLAAALLAALAFGFDFLHGTVPLMFALLLGCAALRSIDAERSLRLVDVGRITFSFGLATVAALATKLFALFVLVGSKELAGYFGQLSHRMGGAGHSIWDVIYALRYGSYQIGWGYGGPIQFLVAVALVSALLALFLLPTRWVAAQERMALVTALASIAAIIAWYMLFRNHTAIHTWWMVRLLTWVIVMGPTCLLLALISGRRGQRDQVEATDTY